MGLPSQRSDDDSALVDEITRSIDGAGDAKKVRSLLNAWWRYAGVRAAAGAEVDAEKFLAERSALGLLELPVATSRAVIELEYAIANGPQGPLPVVVAPELTPVTERPIAVVPPPAPEPEPEPDVEEEPVAELADEAAEEDFEDEPSEVEEPVAEVEPEADVELEPEAEVELESEAEVELDDDEVEAAEEPVAELELDDEEELADLEPVAGFEVTDEIVVEDDDDRVDEPPAAAGPSPAPGFEAEFGNVPSPAAELDEDLPQEFEDGDPAPAPLALVPEPEVEPEPEHEPEVVSAPEAAYEDEPEDGSAPEVEQDEPEAAFEPEPELDVEENEPQAAFEAQFGFEAEDQEPDADAGPESEQRFVMLPIAGFTPEPELLDELEREAAAEQEVVPEPADEPELTADDDVADAADAAPIPVAALLVDADDAELPEDWQSLDAPVPITQFDRFRHDRAERTVENAERAKVAVYAGLIVFFAVVIGVAMAASLAITHIPVPGGDAASIIEPWRAWLAIVTGVAGVVVATLIARRRGLQMFGPRIGLGGLALTGLGLLAGSVIAAAAGGIVLLGGAALGAVRRA